MTDKEIIQIEDAIDLIKKLKLEPEDIFDIDDLNFWAESVGYVKENCIRF